MDQGFQLPDEVHALGYVERYKRSRFNSDLCALDESRYFLRAVIPLAFTEKEGAFHWGVWVEVSQADHDWYVDVWTQQNADAKEMAGRIANDIPGYGGTLGAEVEVKIREGGYRPFLLLKPDSSSALALEQRKGVSDRRHHEILETVGFFEGEEDDV
jgi:hypothetical protein